MPKNKHIALILLRAWYKHRGSFNEITEALGITLHPMDQYTKGNRTDLADIEQDELNILNEFLPSPLSEEEMSAIIDDAIKASGASSIKDMGKVMGIAISKMAGRGDGAIVSKIVKEKLS